MTRYKNNEMNWVTQAYETNIQAVISDVTLYSYANYLISNCCIVSLY